MFLNEEFLKLWEQLSELNEAKADTQKLIDFVGGDLANRFLAIKSRLKAPENDLYYWIKNKTPEEFEAAIIEIENTKSSTQKRKEAVEGGILVNETPHWKIYHITTFEASQYYGRDTKWCITGVNNYGDKYWRQYTNKGITFYFLIAKDNYNPRGNDSKIALALYPNKKHVEVFNQQDYPIFFSAIPYFEEIDIPGITFQSTGKFYCYDCNTELDEEDCWQGLRGENYCEECFKELYFKCNKCGQTFYLTYIIEDEAENRYCHNCADAGAFSIAGEGFYYKMKTPELTIEGVAKNSFEIVRRLMNYLERITTAEREETHLMILSRWTGEILYEGANNGLLVGTESDILKEVTKVLREYEVEA